MARIKANTAKQSAPSAAPAATNSTDAINHPVVTTQATHSEDHALAQPSTIVLPDIGVLTREPEQIAAVDTPLEDQYLAALKFNEDELEIMIEPSGEENAPTIIPVECNGESKWIHVGVEVKLKRKFVEILLRSKPITVSTAHEDIGAKVINNRVLRSTRAKYPLSILHDPAQGKGVEWLRRIRAEL